MEKDIININDNIEDIDFYCDEEDLLDEYKNEWSYSLRQRGEEYYHSNKVLKVYKVKNKYIAKVKGTADKPYDVVFELSEEDNLDYSCTCPCDFPCKHEYAVLMAISNKDYEYIELKESIREKNSDTLSIIKEIPAEEIKEYLLSSLGKDKVIFEMTAFNDYFKKYLPLQEYEYYYNNLYNCLVLNNDSKDLLTKYLMLVKQYISANKFEEVVKIIKSIIESYKDTNQLNVDNYLIDLLPSIGMLLRVVYRKSNNKLKKDLQLWINELEQENYYDNYYLEDMILSLKAI